MCDFTNNRRIAVAARRVLSDNAEVAVAKKYSEGAMATELATEYQVSADTIRNAVKRQGQALRPRGGVEGRPRGTRES